LSGLKGRFVCVWNCLIFFVVEYSIVWSEVCHVLSLIQWNFKKKLFRENLFTNFHKFSFVHSRSRTYYALLLTCFGLNFLPDVRHCVYWVLVEIWAPCSSHRIGNKFFNDHYQGWKEGSFVCETVWFFSWVNTHPFHLNLVAFCPKFSGYSYVEFKEKTISRNFLRNFPANQGYPLPKLVNFHPTLCNFYCASILLWKNSRKYFHMFLAPT